MPGRLSSFITKIDGVFFERRALRYGYYLAVILALLFFWLRFGHLEVAFVYTDF